MLCADNKCICKIHDDCYFSHYGVLVDAVGSLLCQREGKGSDVRHPYITILEMEPSTWPYIEQQLNSLIDDYLFNKGSSKTLHITEFFSF